MAFLDFLVAPKIFWGAQKTRAENMHNDIYLPYCKFGLHWLGMEVDQFKPPLDMLNYNASLLYGDTHAQYKAKDK